MKKNDTKVLAALHFGHNTNSIGPLIIQALYTLSLSLDSCRLQQSNFAFQMRIAILLLTHFIFLM